MTSNVTFTATVEHTDEDCGFSCRLEITAKIYPGSADELAEVVGTPSEVCCLEAHYHPLQGDPIKCVPNEDETRNELGMRIWLNASKSWRADVEEKLIDEWYEAKRKREENAEYLAQTIGSIRA